MTLGNLINKKFNVPALDVPYFGPTLAERQKNLKRDQGFIRSKQFDPRARQKPADK